MDPQLLIIGSGQILDEAVSIAEATHPVGTVHALEIHAPDRFNFELPDLTPYPADQWRLFVAIDDRGLNLSRHQLVAGVKARGYKLAKLTASEAQVSPTAVVGENSLIGRGAIIQRNTNLKLNVFVRAWARVCENCQIGNGVFIDISATVGPESELGDFVTVGSGASVDANSKVGRYCELRRPRRYGGQIPDKTFYFDRFENPVSIISPL